MTDRIKEVAPEQKPIDCANQVVMVVSNKLHQGGNSLPDIQYAVEKIITALISETEERVREECARKELEDAGTTMGRVYDIRRDIEGYIGAENEHTDRLAGWVIELCDIATDSALRQQKGEVG